MRGSIFRVFICVYVCLSVFLFYFKLFACRAAGLSVPTSLCLFVFLSLFYGQFILFYRFTGISLLHRNSDTELGEVKPKRPMGWNTMANIRFATNFSADFFSVVGSGHKHKLFFKNLNLGWCGLCRKTIFLYSWATIQILINQE